MSEFVSQAQLHLLFRLITLGEHAYLLSESVPSAIHCLHSLRAQRKFIHKSCLFHYFPFFFSCSLSLFLCEKERRGGDGEEMGSDDRSLKNPSRLCPLSSKNRKIVFKKDFSTASLNNSAKVEEGVGWGSESTVIITYSGMQIYRCYYNAQFVFYRGKQMQYIAHLLPCIAHI